MLNSIYVISRSGLPLYFKELKSKEKESLDRVALLSGAITAIQLFLVEIDTGEANYFVTETNEIYMEMSDHFGVVIIKDINLDYDREIINQILSEITTKISFEFQEIQTNIILSNEQEQKMDEIICGILAENDESFTVMKRFSDENLNNFRAKLSEEINVSIIFLLDNIKTGLETVFFALLANEPIIVCGDKSSTSKIINILKLITPFPFQSVIDYTVSYVDPQKTNVIGIPQELEKEYKNTNVVKITVNKNIAQGSNAFRSLRNLVKKLRNKRTELEVRETLEKEICIILSKCMELLEMCYTGKLDNNQFQKFRKQTPEDLMNLVTSICIKTKPNLKEYIKKHSFFGFIF